MSMYIGEALAGDGNEIAHIDLLIGSKRRPVGVAFANALARQSEGHSNSWPSSPRTLPSSRRRHDHESDDQGNENRRCRVFGPAQAAVAKAVADPLALASSKGRPKTSSSSAVSSFTRRERRQRRSTTTTTKPPDGIV